MNGRVDRERARRAIGEFLRALGYDTTDPTLQATPERVAAAFEKELLCGAQVDVRELLVNGSEPTSSTNGLVLVRGVQVTTICPHHLLPGLGTATVAYLPGDRLIGLGTLARLVDAFARRLTLQEAISQNVVDALLQHAGARGAYCELDLLHTCLAARGAAQPDARLVTAARGGELAQGDGLVALTLALSSRKS